MIIDEVVWNVIKNKHCSFRMKYHLHYLELSHKTSAETSTILPDFVIDDLALFRIRNMQRLSKKKGYVIST